MQRRLQIALLITPLTVAVAASGCTDVVGDIIPARITRPDEAAKAAAEAEQETAEKQAKFERALAASRRVLVMSGDSMRPYDVLGQITAAGSRETYGINSPHLGVAQTTEHSPFDDLKLSAVNLYGDRADAVIGVVCQGLTCTGTAIHWK